VGAAGVGAASVAAAGVGAAGVGAAGVGAAEVCKAGVGAASVGTAGVGKAGVGAAAMGTAGGDKAGVEVAGGGPRDSEVEGPGRATEERPWAGTTAASAAGGGGAGGGAGAERTAGVAARTEVGGGTTLLAVEGVAIAEQTGSPPWRGCRGLPLWLKAAGAAWTAGVDRGALFMLDGASGTRGKAGVPVSLPSLSFEAAATPRVRTHVPRRFADSTSAPFIRSSSRL
jgi:hypothetical protein